ncbi:unnamed protein product [Cuscuta campestris]|uniref:Uncharacterized protein n=1 Tax=Cuscuta campestris TaxID=132261 RepID=A0A484M8I7_9ASTE|nr:unnamed protein product [Cuscuta campestris]
MSNSKKGSLPMTPGTVLSKSQSPSTPEQKELMMKVPYASAIGSIIGEKELKVVGYRDASFQTDRDDSKSQAGYLFCLNGGAFSWKSFKEDTTADSTTEAEYIAAAEAAKEAVWIKKFITELGAVPSINTGAIAQAKEPRSHQNQTHFVFGELCSGQVVSFVSSDRSMSSHRKDSSLASPTLRLGVLPGLASHSVPINWCSHCRSHCDTHTGFFVDATPYPGGSYESRQQSECRIAGNQTTGRFLAYMGPDEEDDSGEVTEDVSPLDEDTVILADVSSLNSLASSLSPRALKLVGSVNTQDVQVLLDGCSTHNFIHPTVAGRLSLVLHPVPPFRVYVANRDSLRCAYSCPRTPLLLQCVLFEVDLYLLEIHGPDVVLGVQWLQTLGKVSHDYANMTMEFCWNGSPVTLRGNTAAPNPISFSHLCSLAAQTPLEFFELLPVTQLPPPSESAEVVFPTDVPPPVRTILESHATVFQLPQALPPVRMWDHRIHLAANTKPVNVRPYRYPYF